MRSVLDPVAGLPGLAAVGLFDHAAPGRGTTPRRGPHHTPLEVVGGPTRHRRLTDYPL
jgi:hypothetical protein